MEVRYGDDDDDEQDLDMYDGGGGGEEEEEEEEAAPLSKARQRDALLKSIAGKERAWREAASAHGGADNASVIALAQSLMNDKEEYHRVTGEWVKSMAPSSITMQHQATKDDDEEGGGAPVGCCQLCGSRVPLEDIDRHSRACTRSSRRLRSPTDICGIGDTLPLGEGFGVGAVVRRLGRGQFGSVFEVRTSVGGCSFAVKTVQLRAQKQRDEAEALMLSETLLLFLAGVHENLVSVRNFVAACEANDSGAFLIVLDLVPEGTTLHRAGSSKALTYDGFGPLYFSHDASGAISHARGDVSVSCMGIILQLARALGHLHGCGILHQDVKPSNILVVPPGGMIKLTDFGLSDYARPVKDEPLTTRFKGCTRSYSSPEVIALIHSLENHRRATSSFSAVLDNATVTPGTTDCWAFALVALQLFSARRDWPTDDGSKGHHAFQQHCARKTAANVWSPEQVACWMQDHESAAVRALKPFVLERKIGGAGLFRLRWNPAELASWTASHQRLRREGDASALSAGMTPKIHLGRVSMAEVHTFDAKSPAAAPTKCIACGDVLFFWKDAQQCKVCGMTVHTACAESCAYGPRTACCPPPGILESASMVIRETVSKEFEVHSLPKEIKNVIARCFDLDPGRRPLSMAAVADDLGGICGRYLPVDIPPPQPRSDAASAAALHNLALSLEANGQREEAVTALGESLRLRPSDAATLRRLIDNVKIIGSPDLAIDVLSGVALWDDDEQLRVEVLFALGLAFHACDDERCISVLQQCRELESGRVDIAFALAEALLLYRHADEAVAAFSDCLLCIKDGGEGYTAACYFGLGRAYWALSEDCEAGVRSAIAAFRDCLEVSPDHEQAVYFLGFALQKNGQLKCAADAYQQYLDSDCDKVDSDCDKVVCNMAVCLCRIGRRSEAIDALQHMLGKNPRHSVGLANLAWCFAAESNKAMALDCLEKAIAAGFDDVQLCTTDGNFASLQQDKWFIMLIDRMRAMEESLAVSDADK